MPSFPTTGLPNTTNGNLETTRLVTVPIITAIGTRSPSIVYYDKPFNLINFTSTTTDYATYFTLVTPLTSRQPLFTANAPFLNGLITRVWFFQRYRRPQIISLDGSSDITSLLQLDNPLNKVSITDPVSIEEAAKNDPVMGEETITYPTIYGGTTTSTISTTVTANPGDVIYLQFPSQTQPDPIQYTTLPIPTDFNSKQFPIGLPILVITQVEGVLVNLASSTFSTATIVQAPPPSITSDPDDRKVALADPLYKFSTWSKGEKVGVIIAGLVTLIVVAFLLAHMRKVARQRKKQEKDAEKVKEDPDLEPIPWWAIGQILRRSLQEHLGLKGDRGKNRLNISESSAIH